MIGHMLTLSENVEVPLSMSPQGGRCSNMAWHPGCVQGHNLCRKSKPSVWTYMHSCMQCKFAMRILHGCVSSKHLIRRTIDVTTRTRVKATLQWPLLLGTERCMILQGKPSPGPVRFPFRVEGLAKTLAVWRSKFQEETYGLWLVPTLSKTPSKGKNNTTQQQRQYHSQPLPICLVIKPLTYMEWFQSANFFCSTRKKNRSRASLDRVKKVSG